MLWKLSSAMFLPSCSIIIYLSHKSHNAPVSYPKMHHFVTEMCICVHIFVTKWCVVGYLPDAHRGLNKMASSFCRQHFQLLAFSWLKFWCILMRNLMKFLFKGPVDNHSVLVQVMAITWANNDPDLWCHMWSLGHDELTINDTKSSHFFFFLSFFFFFFWGWGGELTFWYTSQSPWKL